MGAALWTGMPTPRPPSPDRPTGPFAPQPPPTPTMHAVPRPALAPPDRPPPDHPPADDPRVRAVAADVARRLRTGCGDMPADAFDALVLDIARFRLRWEGRER